MLKAPRRASHLRLQSILYAITFFFFGSSAVLAGGGAMLSGNPTHLASHPAAVIDQGARRPDVRNVAQATSTAQIQTHVQAKIVPPTVASQPAHSWQLVEHADVQQAMVGARAAVVIDNDTGEVLLEKNADEALPEASITKLMTAYVVLDRASMDTVVRVSSRAAATPPTNLPLGAGEQLTVRELLSALLLPSANDAANALADGLGGEGDFVQAMNDKARQLGLTHTHFSDVTGFDAPNHAASAKDLVVLAHHLFAAHPELLALTQQPTIHLNATATHKAYHLVNFHPLVSRYAGYLGGKPGFTGDAGYCLLTMAQRQNRVVIAVVLNSPDYAQESINLLNAGFGRLGL